jgi:SAM-dependent methyltransferase
MIAAVVPDERLKLRAVFDEDADLYDRTRPVAPGDVFDDLLRLSTLRRGANVLEIGCGTGQATRPLAERGLRVVAVELGANLAARARQNLATLPVEVVTGAFEEWTPGDRDRAFDAVFSCNAFHWIDPDIRFIKAASLLAPGGRLILMATHWVVPDDADSFWHDIQDDYAAVGGDRVDPATKHPDRVTDFSDAIARSGVFTNADRFRRLFDVTFSTDDYVGNLSTQSGIRDFDPAARTELLSRVRRRIDAVGGSVRATLLTTVNIGVPAD